ncbi:MAG: glycosyltransferase family 9 protein [Pseudomonadota bacterium]
MSTDPDRDPAEPEDEAPTSTPQGSLVATGALAEEQSLRNRLGGEGSRIAVLDTSYVGDIVFTSVLAYSIRRAWPEAHVLLVARPGPAQLARGLGYSGALEYDKAHTHQGLGGMDRVLARLQALKCQALLVPHRSVRSAMFSWRSKLFMRVGFAGDRIGVPLSGPLARLAFTHRVPYERGATFTGQLLRLLEPLGIAPVVTQPRFRTSVDAKTHVTDLLADRGLTSGSLVALAPGSVWATKRWPTQHWARLADALLDRGQVPIVIGAEHERPLLQAIRERSRAGERILDGMATTLDQAAEIMRRAGVVVAGDTGLLHLGRAVGARCVALFGPTDPARHDFDDKVQVCTVDLPCRPCSEHGQAQCPEKHHRCMHDLADDVVLRAMPRAD